jgi:hypothetical protein
MNNDTTVSPDTNVKFNVYTDDTNAFSIRCGKCADIHNAQLEGKTQESCNCDCHGNNYTPYYPPYNPCVPDPCCPTYPIYYTGTVGDLTSPQPWRLDFH